jgi:excisionase family DNA binding protein
MTTRNTVSDTIPLLTPAEVAAAFRVDPKTVTRWAKSGKLNSIRTLGGHRRFLATEVRAMLLDTPASEQASAFLPWNGTHFHGQ